ncbi:MAG: hypothetical protein K1X28_08925 [Parachlamydiales bacterium]|nr:hypothetical protein [Parachlamydiales bacterium]
MPISKSSLDAILAYVREQGPYVLASSEDADYFRKNFKKPEPPKPEARPEPVKLPPPPIKIEAPKPEPARPEPARPEPVPIKPAPLPKPTVDFVQVRNVLSVVAPELAILDDIPSDEIAKKLSERWKTKNQSAPISILTFQEPEEQKTLLTEIAKAIDIYFGPAKIVNAEKIEKDKQWGAFLSVEGLKMVIVCDYTLWQLSSLMQHYKETPAQGIRMLGNVPLFLLPDLSLYLKDALLKRSLWKALCQKCS